MRSFEPILKESIGFLTYSEGCNDDVNKIVWSALGWDPDARVVDILREYSGYFISDRLRDDFAQGLLARLERNWRGPLVTNEAVTTTLKQFQAMEKSATPRDLLNWALQRAGRCAALTTTPSEPQPAAVRNPTRGKCTGEAPNGRQARLARRDARGGTDP